MKLSTEQLARMSRLLDEVIDLDESRRQEWLQALPSETAAGRAALEDSATWFHGPAKVVAWGRRPAIPPRG